MEVSATITNDGQTALRLVIEPWGVALLVPAGRSYLLRARSATTRGNLDIDRDPEQVTVYGWPGSVVDVFDDGRIVESLTMVVPEVPAGTSVREFLDLMFKGESTR